MEKYSKYNYILRNVVVATIFVSIYSKHSNNSKNLILYLGMFTLLILNDYLRHNYFWKPFKRYIISLVVSIIGGSILAYWARGYTDVYMYILIYEIVMFLYGWASRIMFSFLFICIFASSFYGQMTFSQFVSKSFWLENGLDLLMFVFLMTIITFSILYIKVQDRERKRVQKLNDELNNSYKKLHEYSKEIEKLTLSRERNRVAQEIHDSLGHSLTALIMHIDYVENIVDKDANKARDIIVKIQDMARNSMKDVRKAIYALKEHEESIAFIDSLNELKRNLSISQKVKINYNVSRNVEEMSPDMKSILYKTIKEGLTNSIKHGNATVINVEIKESDSKILLQIKDNGLGCDKFKIGNGLSGIQKRIDSLKGEVTYTSEKDHGFIINIEISL